MVDVRAGNNSGNTVTYNVNSDTVDYGNQKQDSLMQLGASVGLETMQNTLNQESQSYDAQLREQQFEQNDAPHEEHQQHEQELEVIEDIDSPQKKKRYKNPNQKKSRSQERFEDLASRVATTAQERDYALHEANAHKQRVEELEKAYLALQTNIFQQDIEKTNNIMFEARQKGDIDLEKEALGVLSELQFQQLNNQKILEQVEQQELNRKFERPDPRVEILHSAFDSRELENVALDRWLEDNPECNPYSPEFDSEYLEEVSVVKKSLNKWLLGQRRKKIIGEDEYYDILDNALDMHFGRDKGKNMNSRMPYEEYPVRDSERMNQREQQFRNSEPIRQEQRPQAGYDPYAPRGQDNQARYAQNYERPQQQSVPHTVQIPMGKQPYSPVGAVNRSGYGTSSAPRNALPELDHLQTAIMMKTPFYDHSGKEITDPYIKKQMYQQELARMGR